MPERSDWWIVFSIVVAWILGANAVLMAQNLRSRRKRPGPRPHETHQQHAQRCHPEEWEAFTSPPPSPPLSEATATSEAIGPGSDAG